MNKRTQAAALTALAFLAAASMVSALAGCGPTRGFTVEQLEKHVNDNAAGG